MHEMGHALVALTAPTADPVHRVSIIPRGAAALGMTMQRPLEDRYLLDRARAQGPTRGAPRRTHGGGDPVRPRRLDRRAERPRARDRDRPRHGHRVRHEPEDRPALVRARRVPRRRAGCSIPGARPELSDDLAALIDEETARLVNEAHDRATEGAHRAPGVPRAALADPDRHRGDRRPGPARVLRRAPSRSPSIEELRRDIAGNGEPAAGEPAADRARTSWSAAAAAVGLSRHSGPLRRLAPAGRTGPGTARGTGSSCAWTAGRAPRAPSLPTSGARAARPGTSTTTARRPRVLRIRKLSSMSAVRYQRNLSSNSPTSRSDVAPKGHQVALDRVDLAAPALSWNSRRSCVEMPNGPQTPTAGSASAASSGPSTSPVGSIDPSITTDDPAPRPPQAGVARGAPAGAGLEREHLDAVAVDGRVGLGHVGDHVLHVRAVPRCARKPASARTTSSGQPSTTQCTLTSARRRLVEHARDLPASRRRGGGGSAGSSGSSDGPVRARRPRGTRARRCGRGARPRARSPSPRARPARSRGERPDLLGHLAHDRCLRTKSSTASSDSSARSSW